MKQPIKCHFRKHFSSHFDVPLITTLYYLNSEGCSVHFSRGLWLAQVEFSSRHWRGLLNAISQNIAAAILMSPVLQHYIIWTQRGTPSISPEVSDLPKLSLVEDIAGACETPFHETLRQPFWFPPYGNIILFELRGMLRPFLQSSLTCPSWV